MILRYHSGDYRIVDADVSAERSRPMHKARGNNPAAKMGLRYENRVAKQLQRHVDLGHFVRVEHNPWFAYEDKFGSGYCSPDFLLWTDERVVIIVEVKLTWVEEAAQKLSDLYHPVVTDALNIETSPLIICRNITPEAPPAGYSLRDALGSRHFLLHWPDTGRILW